VKIGSKVLIHRSNEVIPEILGAVEHTNDSADIVKPTLCPYCNSVIVESGANIFCPNRMCRPRVVAQMAHFAQKDAMDIDGFSEMTAGQLYDTLNICKPSQLYRLTVPDLYMLEGFKDKKINNLLAAIEKSKEVSLDKFIFALGIGGVGKVAAKDLAKKFGSIKGLCAAQRDELVAMNNVGEITADGILSWLFDEENLAELNALLAAGITPEPVHTGVASGVFAGQFVVLTGTLPTMKRSEAQKLIEQNGGECQSTVTQKTTLVVAGEAAGSKLDKAKKLGIEIIDEAELKKRLGL
jgi:DNA ligase (NAD+)